MPVHFFQSLRVCLKAPFYWISFFENWLSSYQEHKKTMYVVLYCSSAKIPLLTSRLAYPCSACNRGSFTPYSALGVINVWRQCTDWDDCT